MSFLDAPGITAAGLDTAAAAKINDSGSATRGALNATILDLISTSTDATVPFGWVRPNDPAAIPTAPTPTVTFTTGVGMSTPLPYPTVLTYDTTAVAHVAGIYEAVDIFGRFYLSNTANAPESWQNIAQQHEFMLSGAGFGIQFYTAAFASSTIRVYVDERLAYSGAATADGRSFLKVVFPFAAVRRIRIELWNIRLSDFYYDNTVSDLWKPSGNRKTRAAIFGDSWVGGAGGLSYDKLFGYLTGYGLGWDVASLGHGGSGYVNDGPSGTSYPMTNATRLAKLAAMDLDYAIIFGSINDGAHAASAVGAAATQVYDYMATNSPKTKLIVVGVQHLHTAPSAADIANNDAIKTAALAAPNVIMWLDQLTEAWINSGDAALFIDAAHLGIAGHLKFAKRLIQEIVKP
jgi:hypothetical protein